ncbi:Spx/MgsR family RNA polymerase-binding regulatory protein [Sporolactobacillus kofuensis]|uniref:Spx/MgsR family RNA polymerase-binding regulatory protein n=1 Tax=Sporolactobacillus kofuensis TaxID=269672 RepID=A0ABW1WE11_9BACL|nr:Spx/MgsR family RNA polymerase-binding regulatory protein [Sporolactobacillus kofuensis]
MLLTMYSYPTCGTCRKAKKWLNDHAIAYHEINISLDPPNREALHRFIRQSGQPIGKFFNISGKRYRELGIKEKKKVEPEENWLDWLAADGMLIKRPILSDGEKTTVGFSEALFEKEWGNNQ